MRGAIVRRGIGYVDRIPKALAPGYILVHNHIYPVEGTGERGSRAWVELEGKPMGGTRRVVCKCGAFPHLPRHLRVWGTQPRRARGGVS